MTRVKICGITNAEDARVAVEAGADFLGFIFYPKSPRYVTPSQVRKIVAQYPNTQHLHRAADAVQVYLVSNTHLVGVFVNERPETVAQTLDFCGLDYAQLHGAETPETVSALVEQGYGVIKAFRVRDEAVLAEIERYRATAYLLDTFVAGRSGGTGRTFDWNLAARAVQYGPVVLAGGLRPDNVARAVRVAQPWGVDVSSGVEARPGRKDPDKVRRFVATVKKGIP
jgi:phosphoribosylanthranilate isomerase